MPLLNREFSPVADLGHVTMVGHRLDESKLTFRTSKMKERLGQDVEMLIVNITAPGAETMAYGLHQAMSHGQPLIEAYVEVDRQGDLVHLAGEVICAAVAFGLSE